MIEYRRAKVADLEAVVELGVEALKKAAWPNMVISKSNVRRVVREAIAGASNYCAVAVCDGKIVAAVSAIVHEFMCYERRQASVIQFYSTKPGMGLKLLRDFIRWARGRPAIKAIVFTLEVRADPRVARLLSLLGMSATMPVMMEIL